MEVLRWMGEYWLLTIILASMASETIIRIFTAGRRKACKNCGAK